MTLAARIGPQAAALDDALARLQPLAPSAVCRAGRALVAALAATGRSRWQEVAWSASTLTNTGYPVELSWSSRDASIRWTAEATGPDTPEADRLIAAVEVLRGLGGVAEVPDWLVPGPGRALRFGAWLGGRHDGERDRYKLYADMAGTELPSRVLPPEVLRAVPRRAVWRMAALDAGARSIEVYGRLPRPAVWEVERLMTCCGLHAGEVIALAEQVTGRPCEHRLLPGTSGFSLAARDGRIDAAGFFVPAGPLLGSDAAVSRRLRSVAARYGWDTAIYDALQRRASADGPGRHGMIGFGVAADGRPWMQVGLRP